MKYRGARRGDRAAQRRPAGAFLGDLHRRTSPRPRRSSATSGSRLRHRERQHRHVGGRDRRRVRRREGHRGGPRVRLRLLEGLHAPPDEHDQLEPRPSSRAGRQVRPVARPRPNAFSFGEAGPRLALGRMRSRRPRKGPSANAFDRGRAVRVRLLRIHDSGGSARRSHRPNARTRLHGFADGSFSSRREPMQSRPRAPRVDDVDRRVSSSAESRGQGQPGWVRGSPVEAAPQVPVPQALRPRTT